MYSDPLSQTPTYQKIFKQGREEGLEEGREEGLEEGLQRGLEQGREEGKLEGLQQAVLTVVETRFPPLSEFARQRVTQVRKLDKMEIAFKALAAAPDENTARMMLELLAA
ncbi:MAG TPA: hypothetical protein VFQ30_12810 [Ktedonobacteraceae bacterium]|nr:hypothetical protein [Ktedonobacteraceae bacterium]